MVILLIGFNSEKRYWLLKYSSLGTSYIALTFIFIEVPVFETYIVEMRIEVRPSKYMKNLGKIERTHIG